MRVCFLLLISILLFADLAISAEILGRVVKVDPKNKQIVVITFDKKNKRTLIVKDSMNFSRFRPGDIVRLDLEVKSSNQISVRNIKPFKPHDRTGVRRRLKMRRGFCGKRR